MHFHREIDQLKQLILKMGTIAEDRLRRACTLLKTMDEEEARRIIGADWEIDDMEIRVEEECLKILALHQPVARDLRLIVSIIKINTELERIADIAVNIAKRIVTIRKKRPDGFSTLVDYQPMATRVLAMVKTSLIRNLHNIITKQQKVKTGDNRSFLALDEELHRSLALHAGREYAWRVTESIKAQMDRVRFLSYDFATPKTQLIAEHLEIVDSIETGNPELAARCMEKHLREILSSLPRIAEQYPEYFTED